MLISGKSNMKLVVFLSHVRVLLTLIIRINPCFAEEAGRGLNILCIESEREALLNFKEDLIDRSYRLSSWNAADELDCCKWAGVVCDNITSLVRELRLGNIPPDASAAYVSDAEHEAYERAKLGGRINPSLQHLKHLTVLDLGYNDFGGNSIPTFIGSLASLQHLNLSQAGFSGIIPSQIGNLSNLHSLGLASNDALEFKNNNLQMLSGLPLTLLELDGVDLSHVGNWLKVINSFSSLVELRLSNCKLLKQPSLPHTLNFSSSLIILDISNNSLGPSIPSWIYTLHNLVSLNLGSNNFEGAIPIGLKNLTLLTYLYLDHNEFNSTVPDWFNKFTDLECLSISQNNLKGPIPKSMSVLFHLKVIDLHSNSFEGSASEIFESLLGKCTSPNLSFKNLRELDLGNTSISGPIPECIGQFTSLRILYLNGNQLNGSIPESLWHLSRLESLLIGQNKLKGIVSEAHLTNLSDLKVLLAAGNSLILNVSRYRVPHFGLESLSVSGWKLGPQFPLWLKSQKELTYLDISGTGISDSIPIWFWNMTAKFQFLSLAENKIYGQIPNIIHSNVPDSTFYLHFNQLDGPLPILSPNMSIVDLSHNSFSGDVAHVNCQRTQDQYRLVSLSLHHNILSGEIADCWLDWPQLRYLWMDNNFFSGRIPSSMGYLSNLQSMHLENNSLSGGLPQSLQNCTGLKTLDLSMNSFTGKLPTWIGKSLLNLRFLIINSNGFEGQIPKELCHLTSLQILDIAHNNFSGEVPTCFKNFTAMTLSQNSKIIYPDRLRSIESIHVVTKGRDVLYGTTVGLVINMDLSSNNFSGEIPNELMDLVALQSLNLSQNNFHGTIPNKLGDMSLLESLDLSWNHLSGEIPPSISDLTFVSHLNLSHNDLSGEIPSSTQLRGLDPSSFVGNNLCGPPLTRNCDIDGIAAPPYAENGLDNEDSNEMISMWFYVGMGCGFMVAFWGFIGPILFKKSWRLAYFRFLDLMWEKIRCKGFLG